MMSIQILNAMWKGLSIKSFTAVITHLAYQNVRNGCYYTDNHMVVMWSPIVCRSNISNQFLSISEVNIDIYGPENCDIDRHEADLLRSYNNDHLWKLYYNLSVEYFTWYMIHHININRLLHPRIMLFQRIDKLISLQSLKIVLPVYHLNFVKTDDRTLLYNLYLLKQMIVQACQCF